MLFSQLTGNESVKAQLRRMVETQTLPPVLLFHGSSNAGKRRMAEELALHLLSSKSPADRLPDLHQIFPDKNGLHSIAAIRELIAETALPPYAAPAKVFIVHHAEKMLPTSSNALLKTLEEPPAATWFILLATDISAMLPTVLARCCPLAFRESEMADPKTHPKTALLLEILQSGLLQGAKSWLPLFQKLEESLKETDKDEVSVEENKGEALLFALLYWMRDLYLLQTGSNAKLYYQEQRDILEKQARELAPISLAKVYSLIERAQSRLAANMRLASALEECLLFLNAERKKFSMKLVESSDLDSERRDSYRDVSTR